MLCCIFQWRKFQAKVSQSFSYVTAPGSVLQSQTELLSPWVSSKFSGFLPPSNNLPVGGLAKVLYGTLAFHSRRIPNSHPVLTGSTLTLSSSYWMNELMNFRGRLVRKKESCTFNSPFYAHCLLSWFFNAIQHWPSSGSLKAQQVCACLGVEVINPHRPMWDLPNSYWFFLLLLLWLCLCGWTHMNILKIFPSHKQFMTKTLSCFSGQSHLEAVDLYLQSAAGIVQTVLCSCSNSYSQYN